jgi:dihydrolipoamide dehydrogenase
LPEQLVIIGAGYIGCEFASIYRTLGCSVTIIEQADRILPGWEPEAGQRVRQALEMRGVSVQIQRKISVEEIEQYEEGVRLPGSGKSALETDLVLVATGRRPNLEELGFGALGIDDSSYLKVDGQMRLPVPGLYAVDDVNGISLLDSTAFSQASVAIESILGRQSRSNTLRVPCCIHTEPAAATVGLSEQEAVAQGIEYIAVSDSIDLASDLGRTVVDPEPTFFESDRRCPL